jgi:hypothetical protein
MRLTGRDDKTASSNTAAGIPIWISCSKLKIVILKKIPAVTFRVSSTTVNGESCHYLVGARKYS